LWKRFQLAPAKGTNGASSEIDSWRKRQKGKALEVGHFLEINDSDI
jgi:hypothetical protein